MNTWHYVRAYTGHDEMSGRWTGVPAIFRCWLVNDLSQARRLASSLSDEHGSGALEFRVEVVDEADGVERTITLDVYGAISRKPLPDTDPCELWLRLMHTPPEYGWEGLVDTAMCDPKYVTEEVLA